MTSTHVYLSPNEYMDVPNQLDREHIALRFGPNVTIGMTRGQFNAWLADTIVTARELGFTAVQ